MDKTIPTHIPVRKIIVPLGIVNYKIVEKDNRFHYEVFVSRTLEEDVPLKKSTTFDDIATCNQCANLRMAYFVECRDKGLEAITNV